MGEDKVGRGRNLSWERTKWEGKIRRKRGSLRAEEKRTGQSLRDRGSKGGQKIRTRGSICFSN